MKNVFNYINAFSIFIAIIITSTDLTAQSKIYGIIKDSLDKNIAGVNVLLLGTSDSSLIKGTLTDAKGNFLFGNISDGNYFIKATYTGFTELNTEAFSITAGNNKDFGILHLYEKGVRLDEVKVASKRPLLEQKIDRLVINVANSVTAAGNTALEILERSPGVIVDHQNGTIAMNGKAGVVVMMNGKISHMPVTAIVQMLSGMTSGNIERIELITTPPANLDAEGNAGYINIVLKENNNFGTNGSYSATVGYGSGWIAGASLNINHRSGKINLYGDVNYSRVESPLPITAYSKISNNGVIQETSFIGDRFNIIPNINGRIGADWQLSKQTIAGVLFSGYYNGYRQTEHNLNNIIINSKLDTIIHLDNREKNYWYNYSGNINLQHNFNENDNLQLNLDYIYYYNNQPVNYHSSYYDDSNSFAYDQYFRSGKKTPIHFVVVAADYAKKLSAKISMQAGAKQTISTFDNTISFENLLQSSWIKDNSLSAIYKLKENYNAAYISFDMPVSNNTELKAGLRVEHTTTNLSTEQTKNIVNRNYTNLFPSIFISHKLNENSALDFSYSRRITRPTFNDLAPFTYYLNANTLITGNAALQASLSDVVKAGLTFKKYLISISYSNEKGAITGFQAHADSVLNKIKLSPENLQSMKILSGVLSIPVDVTAWWSMQYNITGAWQQVNALYLGQPVKVEEVYCTINAIERFALPKNYTIELAGSYYSPQLNGIAVTKASGSLDAGIRKKFKGKGGSLYLNAINILNTTVFSLYVNLPEYNLVNSLKGVFVLPSVKLTYTRSFGKEKLKEKRERNTGAEEEKGRVQ
ncbi:MAG: TonB-dependent receptor [Ginsengibacter sp.]